MKPHTFVHSPGIASDPTMVGGLVALESPCRQMHPQEYWSDEGCYRLFEAMLLRCNHVFILHSATNCEEEHLSNTAFLFKIVDVQRHNR